MNYLEKKKITSKSKVTSTSLEAPIISVIGQPPLRKENISNLIYPISTMKLGEMRPVWKNETKSVPSTTFGNYLRVKLKKNFMEKEALIFCYEKDARIAFFVQEPTLRLLLAILDMPI